MYIVILEDGTAYNIDTDSEFNARNVVEYKLKNRMDYRKISSAQDMKGAIADKNSPYYNSDNPYDGKELKCISGWSYKWN
ncbi:MAG: hypothetical protein K0R54_2086 [Clostridiaceae bacterium]|nr:hypothetical protein [Clostridiaceae bacterium]